MSGPRDWSDRGLRRAGWASWSFHAAMLVLNVTVSLLAPPSAINSTWGSSGPVAELVYVVVTFAFPCVGLLIVHRQPRNRIGWLLLLGIGAAVSVPALFDSYAVYALSLRPGTVPGGSVAAALIEGSWVWPIGLLGIFLILLFPDGRLPSPRWRWLVNLALATMTMIALTVTIGSPVLTESAVPDLANPLFVPALERPSTWALVVLLPTFPACVVASAVALTLRFRRSRGTERQQLKWLAAAGALVAGTYLAAMVGIVARDVAFGPPPRWPILLQDLAVASFALLPLAIATAILRHRLYDIDRILNRTAVYAGLTATLVGTYLVSVLVFRLLLDPLVGQSELAVAGSTLAVAALFRPVRDRIQRGVDRRFYRRKYDAARSVEAFAGRLRQEVDLDAVSSDLRVTIRDTMEPAHVSLWLREGAR